MFQHNPKYEAISAFGNSDGGQRRLQMTLCLMMCLAWK